MKSRNRSSGVSSRRSSNDTTLFPIRITRSHRATHRLRARYELHRGHLVRNLTIAIRHGLMSKKLLIVSLCLLDSILVTSGFHFVFALWPMCIFKPRIFPFTPRHFSESTEFRSITSKRRVLSLTANHSLRIPFLTILPIVIIRMHS